MDGLTLNDVRSAISARLIADSFGADGPKYKCPVTINGIALGDLPLSKGDQWTEQTQLTLTEEAIQAMIAGNRLQIANPQRDCFKLRNVYMEFTLIDGRKASSYLVTTVHCSAANWLHNEGAGVAIGEQISINLPLPVATR